MKLAIAVNIEAMNYPGPGASHDLIQDLKLEVELNAFISLLGRTGAGKTTLLRMIAGLERRFKGSIEVFGAPVRKPVREIQLVFQDYRLFPWKTVYENIAFAISARNQAERARVEKWIDIVGLRHRAGAWPKSLSGGEAGRTAFARAFVDQPKVLLLDEPFRGLDIETKFGLQDELLKALSEQKATVIMVSHSIDDAVFLSDCVYVMTDSPMKVETAFLVPIPHPRQRGDPQLAAIAAEITRFVASHKKELLT